MSQILTAIIAVATLIAGWFVKGKVDGHTVRKAKKEARAAIEAADQAVKEKIKAKAEKEINEAKSDNTPDGSGNMFLDK